MPEATTPATPAKTNFLTTLVAAFVLSMLSNCVLAWTAHKLWSWFCVPSLGAGPTIGAWFGAGVILSCFFVANQINLKRQESNKADVYFRPIAIVLSCLLALGMAWTYGTILGWKA